MAYVGNGENMQASASRRSGGINHQSLQCHLNNSAGIMCVASLKAAGSGIWRNAINSVSS